MKTSAIERLRRHGIQPSAQRVAVAEYVLATAEHPSADQVWARVKEVFPLISRATVYNSLHLFVQKGLLRSYALTEGPIVFDPHVEKHHHFIDDDTGAIHDVPWDSIQIGRVDAPGGFEVREVQVVMRGRRRGEGGQD